MKIVNQKVTHTENFNVYIWSMVVNGHNIINVERENIIKISTDLL